MSWARTVSVSIMVIAPLMLAMPAMAQDVVLGAPQGNAASPVATEDNGPYAVKGVPLGGFRLFPAVEIDGDYDSNVYRTPNKDVGQYYVLENPNALLASQWGRHALDIYAGLAAYQYLSGSSEDHQDWDVGGDGRLDISRGVDLNGGASYSQLHESRSSPDLPQSAAKPTEYDLTHANAAFHYDPYRFGFTVGATLDHYVYDATALTGGGLLDNTDRNRDEYAAYARGSYEFSPGYAAYVELDSKNVDYQLHLDRFGFDRNNTGYSVNAGLQMQVTHLVQGQIFAGYLDQHYHAPLINVDGLTYGANIDWMPTELWTFHLTGSRTLNATVIPGASAEDDKSVKLAADYLFRLNVTIHGYVGYMDSKFTGTSRDDQYPTAGVSVSYLLNHNMSLDAGYDYQKRSSNAVGEAFDDDLFHIGINFHI